MPMLTTARVFSIAMTTDYGIWFMPRLTRPSHA